MTIPGSFLQGERKRYEGLSWRGRKEVESTKGAEAAEKSRRAGTQPSGRITVASSAPSSRGARGEGVTLRVLEGQGREENMTGRKKGGGARWIRERRGNLVNRGGARISCAFLGDRHER